MEGYSNQPIPKEAAKQLLALDLEDKEILTYEKLDQRSGSTFFQRIRSISRPRLITRASI